MPLNFIYFLFFLSGFPALFYQLAWQRSLFDIFGINIEATTTVVTAFMLGLGLGNLLGGWLSTTAKKYALYLFSLAELLIGLFGYSSLHLFNWVNHHTLNVPLAQTFLITLALIGLPTLCMGATLPLLVNHLLRRYPNVGYNVGGLYFVNTLGSGIACLSAAIWAMNALGLSGIIHLAATFNILIGCSAFLLALLQKPVSFNNKSDLYISAKINPVIQNIPFILGIFLALLAGYIALSYEIILIRTYSFLSQGRAWAFAFVLGFYLIGLAYGGLLVRHYCERSQPHITRTLANIILCSSILGYLLLPAIANIITHISFTITLVLISILSAMMGSVLPLLSHILIKPNETAGQKIGFIYFANVIGSALGSFITGFILLDYVGIEKIILLLSFTGIGLFIITKGWATKKYLTKMLAALLIAVGMWLLAPTLFTNFYEKIYYKKNYTNRPPFARITENKEGVIAITANKMVLGNGTYDGYIDTNLLKDINWISRAYAISAFHPHPTDVLIIGLSTGAWTQVIAHNPQVHKITIIEINPGYLKLIPHYPAVASLLKNPKVNIIITDGRRWLRNHPEQRFDLIVMNTTFYWREYANNLLSVDFLQLARKNLKPGGILYYNTTFSNRALYTGLATYPYGLRYIDMLAVSDLPIVLNKKHWKKILSNYKIDDTPILYLAQPAARKKLQSLLALIDKAKTDNANQILDMEYKDSMLKRIPKTELITDNNMGNEWQ